MPLPRKFGFIPTLPNAGSPHQTAASLLIDNHYANLQLTQRWTWERYVRFCQFMEMTPYELGSLAMLKHDQVERFKETGTTRGMPNIKACLMLLTLIELHLAKGWTEDVIEQPFPNISASLVPPS